MTYRLGDTIYVRDLGVVVTLLRQSDVDEINRVGAEWWAAQRVAMARMTCRPTVDILH